MSGVSSSYHHEPLRTKTKTLLTNVFNNHVKEPENLDKIVLNLEKGIFNWSIQCAKEKDVIYEWSNPYFITIYKNKVRSIYENLKKNSRLIELVVSNQKKPHELVFMTHMEMCPDIWMEIIQQWEFIKKQELETNVESMTDAFLCKKCHSRKTTYYQMQTRSADEPMTVFVSCLVCGTRWKC
jgi:transcription elongation factor S-II